MALNPFSLVRPITVSDSGSFTRNSIGTYLGKDGYLKIAVANEPRFQYDASGVPQGLLYEAASSNYFKNTNNLADTTNWGNPTVGTQWTATNSTQAGPDGIATADGRVYQYVATATPAAQFLRQLNFLGVAGTYTVSLYVYVPTQAGVTSWTLYVDAQDTENASATASTVFDKWVRASITLTLGGARTWFDFNILFNGVAPTSGQTFYACFPQCEPGTAMTSYFPNFSTSAVGSRSADLLSGMVSNVPEPTTNQLAMSEQFDQAVWGKGNLSVTADSIAAPLTASGPFSTSVFSSADTLIPTAVSSNFHEIHQDSVIPVGAVACLSCYLKAGAYSGAILLLGNASATTYFEVAFDLSTGTVGGVPAISGGAVLVGYGIQSIGNGWYRCWVAGYGNAGAGGVHRGSAIVYQNGSQALSRGAFTGDGTSGIYGWGMQLVPGPYALPYMGTQSLVNATNTDAPTWNSATTYAVGNQASRMVSGVHNIYQRLTVGATATAPESDTTNWVLVSATNKWKMFDLVNETQTWFADDIQIAFMPNAMCDTVMLDNLDSDSVRCFTADGSYNQTIQTKTRACSNWFQYFFEQFVYKKSAAFVKLPLVTTNLINVIVRKVTSYPKVGTVLVGFSRTVGYAEPGGSIGIIDYSTRSTDQFGNTTVVKRAYSKRMNLAVIIDNADLDSVQDLLASYRATPVGWLGAGTSFTSLIVFGFYKSFDIVIAYPTQSRCNLDIEGLT